MIIMILLNLINCYYKDFNSKRINKFNKLQINKNLNLILIQQSKIINKTLILHKMILNNKIKINKKKNIIKKLSIKFFFIYNFINKIKIILRKNLI